MSDVEDINEFANSAKPARHGSYQTQAEYSVIGHSHIRLVVIVALAVFLCEYLLMTIALMLPLHGWLLVALDASLLTIMLLPVLHYFMLRPLVGHIRKCKQTETVLRESELRLKTIFGTSPDSITISRLHDGRIIDVNDGFCTLTGYAKKEVLGKSTLDLLLWQELQDREQMVDGLQKHGYVNNIEAGFKLKDGRIFDGLVSARTITLNSEPHILAVTRDITEWKKAQKRLRASHKLLEIVNRHNKIKPLLKEFIVQIKELTNCAVAGIRIFDENGNITYQDYENFNLEFCEVDNSHTIDSIHCMCSNMILGKTKSPHVFLTEGNSCYVASTSRFLSTLSETEKNQICGVCSRYGYESVALTPMFREEKILGLIHVADPRQHMFSEEAIGILERASQQLGTAIKRIQAEEAVRQARRELEQRVEERTALLNSTNEQLHIKIEEGKLNMEKLRSLASKLVLTEERERRRIAVMLHDRIGQTLAISKIKLGELREELPAGTAADTLIQIRGFIEQTIQDTRSLTFELSPPILYELGFEAALSWLTNQTREKTGLRIEMKNDHLPKPLNNDCRVIAFQAVREILFNIVKHARARIATISLTRDVDTVRIDIEDDGIGFDTTEVQNIVSDSMGFGLFSIRERLQPLGGRLEIHSKPGNGTRVSLVVPLICTFEAKEE